MSPSRWMKATSALMTSRCVVDLMKAGVGGSVVACAPSFLCGLGVFCCSRWDGCNSGNFRFRLRCEWRLPFSPTSLALTLSGRCGTVRGGFQDAMSVVVLVLLGVFLPCSFDVCCCRCCCCLWWWWWCELGVLWLMAYVTVVPPPPSCRCMSWRVALVQALFAGLWWVFASAVAWDALPHPNPTATRRCK